MTRLYFLCIIFFSLANNSSCQSGWTRKKNSSFTKIDISYFKSSKFYANYNYIFTTPTLHQSSLNLYSEYGVSNRFNLIIKGPILIKKSKENSNSIYGLGDLALELKYRLLKTSKWPISISFVSEFPTGRKNAFAKHKSNPFEQINLPTGDGEFNEIIILAASKTIKKTYTSVFGSYNIRTKYKGSYLNDLYQIGLEFGWLPWKTICFNSKLKAQFSVGDYQNYFLAMFRGNSTTYTQFSFETFFNLSRNWKFCATYLTASNLISPLKNLYVAPYYSIGLIYER